jgi:hypothetical protein
MNINHAPLFNTEKVIAHYEQKDGVSITYVCTTDFNTSNSPIDVFFRELPHPEFGNRYFGLRRDTNGAIVICNADTVEQLSFAMIKDNDNRYWYSTSHHDCLFIDGSMIDGGREYVRSTGPVEVFKVLNGQFT